MNDNNQSIKFFERFIEEEEKELEWMYKEDEEYYRYEIEQKELLINHWRNILVIIKNLKEEIEQKDNIVKHIINRLEMDTERITKKINDKKVFPNHLDDYSRCRLRAYRTKTKELKTYIEEKYFKMGEDIYENRNKI